MAWQTETFAKKRGKLSRIFFPLENYIFLSAANTKKVGL
jgi:hypothetical protein